LKFLNISNKMITLLQKIGIYVGASNAIMFHEIRPKNCKIEYNNDYLKWVAFMSFINPIICPIYISIKIWDRIVR